VTTSCNTFLTSLLTSWVHGSTWYELISVVCAMRTLANQQTRVSCHCPGQYAASAYTQYWFVHGRDEVPPQLYSISSTWSLVSLVIYVCTRNCKQRVEWIIRLKSGSQPWLTLWWRVQYVVLPRMQLVMYTGIRQRNVTYIYIYIYIYCTAWLFICQLIADRPAVIVDWSLILEMRSRPLR